MNKFMVTFTSTTSLTADGNGNVFKNFQCGTNKVSIPAVRNGKPITWFDDSKLIKPEYRK